ncbi:MAG: hypothetical protein QOG63_1902 [Thermoleophilaceae bacterium]|nr:hypothetical protein [Thermoleophilaceae bacterium]
MTKQLHAGLEADLERASLECIDDDGRFCVVRATGADAGGVDDVVLSVAWQDRDYRFTPVELDAEAADDRSHDFLIPSRLLGEGEFKLHCGTHRVALGAPESHAPVSTAGMATEQALLVQHDQLLDHARRLSQLRSDMRGLHTRAAAAEDALEDAQSRFHVSLLGQRSEVQDARDQTAQVDAELAAVLERAADLEAALMVARAALEPEQQARAEAERSAAARAAELAEVRGQIQRAIASNAAELEGARAELEESRAEAERSTAALADELERARAEARAAAVEVDAARRALEAERGGRADVEARLASAEARLDDKAARIADLEDLARRRGSELDEVRAAAAKRETELLAALDLARAESERERTARAATEELREQDRAAQTEAAAAAEAVAAAEPEAEPAATAEPEAPSPATAKLEADLAAVRTEVNRVRAANAHIAARLRHAEQALAERTPPARRAAAVTATMGARLIALDMALKGTPRDETARYLSDSFGLDDSAELLDRVYAQRS